MKAANPEITIPAPSASTALCFREGEIWFRANATIAVKNWWNNGDINETYAPGGEPKTAKGIKNKYNSMKSANK